MAQRGNVELSREERYRSDWPLLRQTLTLADLADSVMVAEMLGITDLSLRNHINTTIDGRNMRHYAPEPVIRAESRKPMWLREEAHEFAKRWEGIRAFRSRRNK